MILKNKNQAFAVLKMGMQKLSDREAARKERWAYFEGNHIDLPYAPKGVDDEYLALREISPLPLIRLAVRTPVQRLRIKGMQMQSDEIAKRHRRIWQLNRMDSQQRTPYIHSMVYSTGFISVWPNADDREKPIIRTEDPNNTWVEYDPADITNISWSVKHWTEQALDDDGKWTTVEHGAVYDDEAAWRFTREYRGEFGMATNQWTTDPKVFPHNLGVNPITPFTADIDGNGKGASFVDPLMPMQRAIDTMRFDLLLAAQFAAYRQRVATGYDPVLRDGDGNPIYQTYPTGHVDAGELILDANNLPIPIVQSPGKVGVDRLLAFPGVDTKIFDLPESNLENYATGLNLLVSGFAAVAQLPPSYLGASDFKNVSADLMTATEATLQSLIKDMQTGHGESMELVHQKVGLATGDEAMVDYEAETIWEETGPVSLQQIADFASKMVPLGYPMRSVVEKVPGTSQAQAASMDLTPPTPPAAPAAATPPGEPVGAPRPAGDPPAADAGGTE